MPGTQAMHVQTYAQGAVPEDAMDMAVRRVRSVLRQAPEPVLLTRVKLTMAADPAAERPAIAQASVDLNGRLIRAQAAAETMREAIERMCDRLSVQMEGAARNWAAIRGRQPMAQPHEWRHLSAPTPRMPYWPRPADESSVVRHKSYTLSGMTPDEAVADLELLDYDFHLFTEKATGEDSIVYRTDCGYRLAQAHPRVQRLGPVSTSITVSEHSAPRIGLAQAKARLEALGWPFLFFVDSQTGRGNLIYHRYDGHYGLITPAAS